MRVLLTADPGIAVPPKLYGGIERIVDGLAKELRQRGHQIGLVASSDSECPVDHFYPWPFTRPTSGSQHLQHLAFYSPRRAPGNQMSSTAFLDSVIS